MLVGALCVPCAEVLLPEASGGLVAAPESFRNFPQLYLLLPDRNPPPPPGPCERAFLCCHLAAAAGGMGCLSATEQRPFLLPVEVGWFFFFAAERRIFLRCSDLTNTHRIPLSRPFPGVWLCAVTLPPLKEHQPYLWWWGVAVTAQLPEGSVIRTVMVLVSSP